MQVQLCHFSGTGNTRWLAARLDESLAARGITATPHIITQDAVPEIPESSDAVLCILYPVYALDAPELVQEWVSRLPEGKGSAAVVVRSPGDPFCNGGTVRTMRRLLAARGWQVVHETMIVMPPNIFVRVSDRLAAQLLEAARKRTTALAGAIAHKRFSLQNTGFFLHYPARFAARLLARFSYLFGRDLSVTEACTHCGICVRECPVRNINLTYKVLFSKKCILCLRCIALCPVQAIKPRWLRFFPAVGYKLNNLNTAQHPKDLLHKIFERGYNGYLKN